MKLRQHHVAPRNRFLNGVCGLAVFFPVHLDGHAVTAIFSVDMLHTEGVVPIRRRIASILAICRWSKVVDAIIERISVDVIERRREPTPVPQKYQSVGWEHTAMESDSLIPATNVASTVLRSSRSSLFPIQMPVQIVELFMKGCGRGILGISHSVTSYGRLIRGGWLHTRLAIVQGAA